MVKILNSYRNKLIATFIFISVIPILIMGFSINYKIRTKVVDEGIEAKKHIVQDNVDKMEMWFYEKEQLIKSMSNNYPLIKSMINSPNSFENVNNYLKSNSNANVTIDNSFVNTFITMTDGRNFNSSYYIAENDVRKRNWYINAYITKDISWSQPYEDMITGKSVITVSIPLINSDGDIEGVLGADIDFNQVKDRLMDIKIDDNSTTYIVTPQGGFYNILGEKIESIEGKNLDRIKRRDFISNLNYDGVDTISYELEEKYFGIYDSMPGLKWRIVTLTKEKEFYESLTRINTFMVYAIIFTAILIIIASIFFSRLLSKSFDSLMEGTLEIQKGNYDHKIPVEGSDEFAMLALAFNNTTSKLKESYNDIRNSSIEILKSNNKLKEKNEALENSYMQLKITSDELNNSRTEYKNLIDNMQDMVWVLDKDYNILFLNDRIEDILKYSKEELIGKNIKDLMNIWEDVNDERLDRLKLKDYKNTLVTHRSKDGTKRILELTSKRLFKDEELISIQGVARDVTDRMVMEEEILRRNTELSTINRIGRNLNSTMDIDKLVKNAAEDIVNLLDLPLCTIRLLTKENTLKLMVSAGNLSKYASNKYISIDDDYLGEVIKTGEIFTLDTSDKTKVNKYNRKVMYSNEAKFINMFPLKARGKTLGVLLVATRDKINDSNINILSSLSNQVAMIIENINLYQGVKDSYMNTIRALTATVEAKDKYTEGHSYRVSKYSGIIAKNLGLPKEVCEEIEIGGILHDVGKIGIDDYILTKDGKLNDEEFSRIKEHPEIGGRILEGAGFSEIIMNCIKYHHLRYDLQGYPNNPGFDELPMEACITGVADAFDAMTSNRSYRRAMAFERAINELISNSNKQFNPHIVDVMVDIYKNNIHLLEEVASSSELAS